MKIIQTNIIIKLNNGSEATITEVDIGINSNLHKFKGFVITDYKMRINTTWNTSGYCNFSDEFSIDKNIIINKVPEYKKIVDNEYVDCYEVTETYCS